MWVSLHRLKSKIYIRVFCPEIRHKFIKQCEETIRRKPDWISLTFIYILIIVLMFLMCCGRKRLKVQKFRNVGLYMHVKVKVKLDMSGVYVWLLIECMCVWGLQMKSDSRALISVAERTSNFCLARKLTWPLVSSDIFTQWGWLIPFCPDLSRAIQRRWKSANLSLPQNLSSWTDVFLSTPLSAATHHHEDRAVWFMDPLGLSFYTQGYTVEYELEELIPPLTIQLLHSWTTFKKITITSLPQQPGLHIYGWTFTPVLKSATQYLPCLRRRLLRSDI